MDEDQEVVDRMGRMVALGVWAMIKVYLKVFLAVILFFIVLGLGFGIVLNIL